MSTTQQRMTGSHTDRMSGSRARQLARGSQALARPRYRRLLSALFVLYLVMDFADPGMPGLLNFTIDSNRDAVQGQASPEVEEPASAPAVISPRTMIPAERPLVGRSPAEAGPRPAGKWLPMLRLAHHPGPASADPGH